MHSALVRFLVYHAAYRKVLAFNRTNFYNPLHEVGLPGIGLGALLGIEQGRQIVPAQLNEISLGRRVSDEERTAILTELALFCSDNRIKLIVVHPSYRDSIRHECLLTRFCQGNRVLMFEAYDSLHPPDLPPKALYLDEWHPTREGHLRLGRDLTGLIVREVLKGSPPIPAPNRLQ